MTRDPASSSTVAEVAGARIKSGETRWNAALTCAKLLLRNKEGKPMGRLKITAGLVAAFAAGTLLDVGTASAAYSFCYEPTAPSAFLRKPTKPYCAINRSCSDWEVNSYRNEVDRYFRNLREYADDVDRYYSEAADYVACMSKLD